MDSLGPGLLSGCLYRHVNRSIYSTTLGAKGTEGTVGGGFGIRGPSYQSSPVFDFHSSLEQKVPKPPKVIKQSSKCI